MLSTSITPNFLNSVQDIIGDTKEVMVYGIGAFGWTQLQPRLRLHGYTVYDFSDAPFQYIFYTGTRKNRECKNALTGLVIENAKRIAQHQKIIPLFFILAKDSKNLNIEKVAQSHSYPFRGHHNISDSELRHCYKMYAETNPIIKKIIEQSFHFVKLHTNPDSIEKIPPFWEDPNWQKNWSLRTHEHNTKKKHYWKDILNFEINKIDPQLLFFKPEIAATNITENKEINKNSLKP